MEVLTLLAATFMMVLGIGGNAFAYSGLLDSYSGWCGYGCLESADTFYNN